MAIGYLQVMASSGRNAIPVVAAKVAVLQQSALIAQLATDASGKTAYIEIDAPEKALSLDSTYTGVPYAVCDVVVSAAKYKDVVVTGVQIFAETYAVLPVAMEPLVIEDGTGSAPFNEEVTYVVDDHSLTGNEEWSPAPTSPYGPRVLDRVIVPEYITVHLGRPDAAAQNVTVSFPYYIKNVCCSEIYPTWPENAIRANVYCQISLALNRIFTEWYPSRGYPFDITNSTSFDQYYVSGRNIFANISDIVDGIFDTYIQKDSFAEPFYAEYCNGTTATCPGLKQWGTVTLAQDGYTPLNILRYYYGSDIYLRTAVQIEGTEQSYDGVALRVGSTGEDVRTIQRQLLRIRQNYPLIPNLGQVDGNFGQATRAAVVAFQNIFSLTPDGIVGKATWYRISYIYVAVTKVAELTSEGIQSIPVPGTIPSVVLREGSSGESVTLAQYLLRIASEFYDSIAPIEIDGSFGPATRRATISFQTLYGITSDGIIGPSTWAALYDIFYGVFDSITPSSLQYPGTALRVGSTGTNVQLIQRKLNVIASFFPSIDSITIDGRFGPATRASVIGFQELFGLTVDGVVGPQTWVQIISVYDRLT